MELLVVEERLTNFLASFIDLVEPVKGKLPKRLFSNNNQRLLLVVVDDGLGNGLSCILNNN